MQEVKTKNIFTRKLACELRKRGCEILRTMPNRNRPEFDIYVFKDNDLLQRSLGEIMHK